MHGDCPGTARLSKAPERPWIPKAMFERLASEGEFMLLF
jgi:hypothetical protein